MKANPLGALNELERYMKNPPGGDYSIQAEPHPGRIREDELASLLEGSLQIATLLVSKAAKVPSESPEKVLREIREQLSAT